jgi:5-methylcytosine-specific restriction endonuclease McrA
MSLKNFYGCKHCITKRTHDIQRTPFNIVQEVFSNNDMVLLDDEYISIETPMSFICINHASEGVRKRTFASVKRLGKCNLCRIEERNKDKPNDRERLSYDIKRWREAVYKRDNYTCQCCKDKKGGNLNAHHIQNFSVHKHLRFDIENGITLCKHCHNPNKKGSFHNVYGTRNNTKVQLEEYIRNHKTL